MHLEQRSGSVPCCPGPLMIWPLPPPLPSLLPHSLPLAPELMGFSLCFCHASLILGFCSCSPPCLSYLHAWLLLKCTSPENLPLATSLNSSLFKQILRARIEKSSLRGLSGIFCKVANPLSPHQLALIGLPYCIFFIEIKPTWNCLMFFHWCIALLLLSSQTRLSWVSAGTLSSSSVLGWCLVPCQCSIDIW